MWIFSDHISSRIFMQQNICFMFCSARPLAAAYTTLLSFYLQLLWLFRHAQIQYCFILLLLMFLCIFAMWLLIFGRGKLAQFLAQQVKNLTFATWITFQIQPVFPLTCSCASIKPRFCCRAACCIFLQDPCWMVWRGVAGSRPASFCQAAALIRDDCGCRGHSRGWLGALLSDSSRAPLFLYYHKQIRGSGEHTQMQIAAERPISTLHHNGPRCMCRPSLPIKHKMNLM